MRLFIFIYNLVIYCLTPWFILRLKWKGRLNQAYGERIKERFGFYNPSSQPRTYDIWLHAVSFGEVEVAKVLIEQWLQQGKSILVTTTTPTGSARIQALFKNLISHVYVPFEWPGAIRRFIKYFQPKLLVIIETELWPNLLRITHQHGLEIIITNARLSQRSVKGYSYIRPLINHILQYVNQVIAQSRVDGERFIALGLPKPKMVVGGNLKFDAIAPVFAKKDLDNQRMGLFGERRVWIAASTHSGEEALILKSFKALKKQHKDLVLVLAPRHPDRAMEVSKLLVAEGLEYCLRTDERALQVDESVFLLDTLGELQLFYYLADLAFVGGSLVAHGGHNVLEAIRANLPVVVGRHMHNFQFMAEQLLKIKGMVQVESIDQLAVVITQLLAFEDQKEKLTVASNLFLKQHSGALKRNIDLIGKHL